MAHPAGDRNALCVDYQCRGLMVHRAAAVHAVDPLAVGGQRRAVRDGMGLRPAVGRGLYFVAARLHHHPVDRGSRSRDEARADPILLRAEGGKMLLRHGLRVARGRAVLTVGRPGRPPLSRQLLRWISMSRADGSPSSVNTTNEFEDRRAACPRRQVQWDGAHPEWRVGSPKIGETLSRSREASVPPGGSAIKPPSVTHVRPETWLCGSSAKTPDCGA